VAATTVLGTRFVTLGWHTLGIVLLILAAAAWPVPVIEELRRGKKRLPGASYLACVATQGLAVLTSALAAAGDGDWLALASFALFCVGVVLYVDLSVRFDPRQIREGHGDQWVAAGAAAIGALAASHLAASSVFTGTFHTALRITALTLLALDLVGYVILLTAEVHWPRLHYDARRWATVFPLGMSAAAAMSVASTTGVAWLHGLGVVLLWVAVAAWLMMLADSLANLARR
jgi:tellurite resistance protein TehA-like permease